MQQGFLQVKFWGVRGSLPSTLIPENWSLHFENLMRGYFAAGYRDNTHIQKYLANIPVPQVGGYGVATTSVEVRSPKTQIIIDGGSGIRYLSEQIMSGTRGSSKGPFHIFMTHFHWDHLIGLPFFTPHFVPGIHINYYAVQPDLEQNIRSVFRKPFFPVPFESLSSKIHFHILEPRKPVVINDMKITPYQLDHPDPCWGYRVESHDRAYAHCVDTEGTRATREELGPDLPLYQNVDLMYFDAQYTFPELAEKANWGHSAAQVGLDIAFREHVKRVIFAHHDPGADINQILELKRQTEEFYNWRIQNAAEQAPEVPWEFAYEGLEIKL